jgi:hypothetical protein
MNRTERKVYLVSHHSLAVEITFCVYTRYALTKISNYKQMLVCVSCIYAVRRS